MQNSRPGFARFSAVWIGQATSLLGSAMTWFALTIWAYEVTGQATSLALISLVSLAPAILLSPVAGALADRWDRRLVLIASDVGTGLGTVLVLLLYLSGSLQVWHLYIVGLMSGILQAFQYPAYAAAVTLLIPKDQYGRAGGMMELAGSSSGILAPLLAGTLLGVIGVAGIMAIDICTLLLAVGTLLLIPIPKPPRSESGQQAQGSLWSESLYGFSYIRKRPGLLGLQLIFAAGNLFDYAGYVLFVPMILARTGGNELALGSVQSAGAAGAFFGGLLLSLWGGPRRKIHIILLGWTLAGVGMVAMGLGQALIIWIPAAFFYSFFEPLINGVDQALWQVKVEPDVQGRVFATQLLLSHCTLPLAIVGAGLLADHVFGPAMMPGGALVDAFGWLVGVGPGAGMTLMVVACGVLGGTIPLLGYAFRAVRDIELLLPDYDVIPVEAGP